MKDLLQKLLRFGPIRAIYGMIAAIVLRLPTIAFFAVSFFAIFWVGQQLFYRYAPSDYFLDFYYAKVDDTPVGTEPLLTLCRRVNTEGIKIEAVRTFINYEEGTNKKQVAGEYQFPAGIEQADSNCQNIRLKKQPQIKGKYSIHTEYVYYMSGNRKSGSYDSNIYEMTQLLTTDQQIEKLQNEVRILQEQIKALKTQADKSTKSDLNQSSNSNSQSSTSKGTAPSANQSRSQATTNTPRQSSPTQPSSPSTPADPVEPSVPAAACVIPIGNIGLLCGDGLIRL